MNGAIGSGSNVQWPPAKTIGQADPSGLPASRSSERMGTPARSSMFRTLV